MKPFLYGLAAVLAGLLVMLIFVQSANNGHSVTEKLGGLGLILVVGAFALAIYFLPTYLAYRGGDPRKNFAAIAALNFFLGWTILGWVVALVWTLSDEEVDGKSQPGYRVRW